MVLALVIENYPDQTLGETVDVDSLVWDGYQTYLKDQVRTERIVLDTVKSHVKTPAEHPALGLYVPRYIFNPIYLIVTSGDLPKVSHKVVWRRVGLAGHCQRHDKRRPGRPSKTFVDTLKRDDGWPTLLSLPPA